MTLTWMFTQVWLWSVAAFVLGSFITWLLFVRPAKRRLKRLADSYRELRRYVDYQQPDYSRSVDPPRDDQHPRDGGTALDLLRPEPEWEDATADAVDEWGRLRGEFAADEPPVQDTQVLPAVPERDEASAEVEAEPADDGDPRPEEQSETPVLSTAELGSWPEATHRRSLAESPPPEVDLPSTELEAPEPDISTSQSTWFQKGDLSASSGGDDWTGTPKEAEQSGNGGSPKSKQLQALFEPVSGDDEPGDKTPYMPPLGTDATQNIPRLPVEDGDSAPSEASEPDTPEAEWAAPDTEPPPLPRRIPGAGPMPGSPSRDRPTVEVAKPQVSSAAQPDESYVVKGHFASKQYHLPESPHYERVVAEVWFRTASEAEQAGFAPWDGWHRG